MRTGRARVHGCVGDEGNCVKSRSIRVLIEDDEPGKSVHGVVREACAQEDGDFRHAPHV